MQKEIVIGVVSALIASIVTSLFVGSKQVVNEAQLSQIKYELSVDESFIAAILDDMADDGRFKPEHGVDGITPAVESGIWPVRNNKDGGSGCVKRGAGSNWQKTISFNSAFRKTPVIHYGLSFVDFETYDNDNRANGIQISASNITNKGFTLKAHSWQGCLYKADISWVAIETAQP